MLAVDNGPEFRGRDLDRWAYEHGVKLFFIAPGKPMQNGSIESFNGRFREECLDPSWFTSLAEAPPEIGDLAPDGRQVLAGNLIDRAAVWCAAARTRAICGGSSQPASTFPFRALLVAA